MLSSVSLTLRRNSERTRRSLLAASPLRTGRDFDAFKRQRVDAAESLRVEEDDFERGRETPLGTASGDSRRGRENRSG